MSYVHHDYNERLIQDELSELLISFIPHDMLKHPSQLMKLRSNETNRIEYVLNEISSIIQ